MSDQSSRDSELYDMYVSLFTLVKVCLKIKSMSDIINLIMILLILVDVLCFFFPVEWI